jgi:anaerobic magnesium-protoporphyrin IX monomethyl ester cyclase
MMFQGTYTSDFYRAVRNLLHDQIALQNADAPLLPEHERAADAIEQRWQELLRNESKYRSSSETFGSQRVNDRARTLATGSRGR